MLGVIITALRSTWGIVLIVIVPCAVIIIFEIMRIVEAVRRDKMARLDEESARKDEEIAELRRKLEEAKTVGGGSSADTDDKST